VNEANQLRKYLADRDVACPMCGYNLRGVTLLACPECGGRIDYTSVDLNRRETQAFRTRVQYPCLLFVGFGSVLLIHTVWDWARYQNAGLSDRALIGAFWLILIGAVSIPALTLARKHAVQQQSRTSQSLFTAARILFPFGLGVGLPLLYFGIRLALFAYAISQGGGP